MRKNSKTGVDTSDFEFVLCCITVKHGTSNPSKKIGLMSSTPDVLDKHWSDFIINKVRKCANQLVVSTGICKWRMK